MRLVKIKYIGYEEFEAIRDVIYDEIPWALINEGYSPKLRTAIFNFWDSDYVPESLKKNIAQPPRSREDIDRLQKRLDEIAMKHYGVK